jgi:hypothetical protein
MKVSELLTLMGHLSVGNDNITPSERAIFLQYLNLAHLELYQETANFNQDLLIQENLTSEQDSNTIKLSRMPYLVSSVYILTSKQKLPRLSIGEAIDNEPDLNGKGTLARGTPTAYFVQKDTIQFVPAQTASVPVIVWYVPQPSPLTEETEEGDIPYPVAYHPVLADGALYYLFQEEGGFKNTQKELEARKRWETGKSKLLSYLYSSSGQSFSTFSSI